MAWVAPFRGILYNPEKIGNLRDVVAPPYDVISPKFQDELYRRDPHNVIRLILNKETPEDSPQDNRYTRAAGYYRAWLREGALIRAPQPAFYFLREEFTPPWQPAKARQGGKMVRRGFIGLIHLEPFSTGVVLPHEKTQSKPKADRLALMEACWANFSQIFSLFPDEEKSMLPIYDQVFSSPTGLVSDVTDDAGTRRKLWMVSETPALRRITEILRPKKIWIADGHHRYETALAFRDRQRSVAVRGRGREAYYFTMMYFAAMEDEGLLILPTHRVIRNLPDFPNPSFLEKLGVRYAIETFAFDSQSEAATRSRFFQELAARAGRGHFFGMRVEGWPQYFLLSLKEKGDAGEGGAGLVPALQALDVNLLQRLVFQDLLGISPQDLAAGQKIAYTQDTNEAIAMLETGAGQAVFFLNPTRVSQVRDVALAGEVMPPKSTFFYPKLLSGLVINSLDPDEEVAWE